MAAFKPQCGICKKIVEDGQESVIVMQKGADGINAASKLRGSDVTISAGNRVHVSCRRMHTDKKSIDIWNKQQSTSNMCIVKKSVRLAEGPFSSGTDCLFCGTTVDFTSKHKPKSEQVKVRTSEFCETIKKCCEKRCDEWSFAVKGRIEYFLSDLHAADCVYHQTCSANFRSGKNIPQEYAPIEQSSKRRKKGRPNNEEQEDAFLKTCTYLDSNDEEQLLVVDLISKMEEYLQSDCKAYDRRHMKRRLEEHYGDRVIISGESGKTDIVTLTETADQILRSYHAKSKDCNPELQKIHLIEAAAKLIKSDVKAHKCARKDIYPSTDDLTTEKTADYLPGSLRLLCAKLFVGTDVSTKVGAIGQSIMQAIRPRALICPLQIGLAIQMHHNFRSRYMIDVLHHLGFCSSYTEVMKFERNAALASSSFSENMTENNVLLFAADNVDHNIRTLDGNNTFHGMGMIGTITPATNFQPTVPRCKVADSDIKNAAQVMIQEYRSSKDLLKDITFNNLEVFPANIRKIDILWQLSWLFPGENQSNWSGMMQTVYNNSNLQHCGKASVRFLPIINIPPSDMSCILSTLMYLNKIAHDQKVPCIVTFDQPLHWKASQIIYQYKDLENTVLMLGSFHTLMNLVGAIGTLMNGSGLNEVLQEIYGPNAVLHMMTGKAISRAIRGHMLVDAALSTLLIIDVFPSNEDGSCHKTINDASALYNSIMSGKEAAENVESSNTMCEIANALNTKKLQIQSSQTSKLWLEYQEMIKTVRKLIAADRTGSWKLHLEAIQECLVIMAAAGHHNYVKSGYKYMQDMLKLPSDNPSVYALFQKGQFVVRRSDRFWAGLGSDLVIEQVLMRSIKSRGGLTRGSGLTEIQQATWLKSMPVCSLYNLAMQEYTRVSFETSEQHKEVGESRRSRDISDFQKVMECMKPISPYDCDTSLRNIITGVIADPSVNVHELHSVGTEIINKMVGKPVYTYSGKRSDRAKTLGAASTVTSADKAIDIDPALLFQRMLTVATVGDMNLTDALNYELCAYPPALFESPTLLRKADKPQLAHAILKMCDNLCTGDVPETQANVQYVLDGGSLLHRVHWKTGDTYADIASVYATFAYHNYGRAIVVFDGYDSAPSIKDMTHRRRINSKISKTVNFTPSMKFVGQKENFLANDTNKQRVITLISEALTKIGCTVQHADGDADFDIVHYAVSSSQVITTITIGEDTDLLILLLHHAKNNGFKLYFRSDIRRGSSTNPAYDILEMQALLGVDICANIIFLHAFTGSDTTSRMFGIGKATALEKLTKDEQLQMAANVFSSDRSQHIDIESAGHKAILILYGCKIGDSLQILRHRMLVEKVAKAKSFVTPERLPPTESAAKYHSFRTYYQISNWKSKQTLLKATDWGWYIKDNSYYPTVSDMPPAPDWLLKMIHCSCKTKCATMRCGCKQNGLPCSASCGECQISGCDNIVLFEYDDCDSDA